jgi:hypothetical protein
MCSVAGTDTTSMTVTQCLLQLVNNPEKLKLLVEEIDRAFPSADEDITFAKTQDLRYMNAVIYEAMRLGMHAASRCLLFKVFTYLLIHVGSDDEIHCRTDSPRWLRDSPECTQTIPITFLQRRTNTRTDYSPTLDWGRNDGSEDLARCKSICT